MLALEKGQVLGHWHVRYHKAGCVHADLPGKPFKALGNVNEAANPLVLVIERFQFRLIGKDILDMDFGIGCRHKLDDGAAFLKRHVQNTPHVLQDGPGLELAVGCNLRDGLFAVNVCHVADNLEAAPFAEVNVYIGQRDALVVEEAFKQQIVGQRIQVGDAHGPGHERACGRSAARACGDAVVLGPVDKFLHDEEVVRKAHA